MKRIEMLKLALRVAHDAVEANAALSNAQFAQLKQTWGKDNGLLAQRLAQIILSDAAEELTP